MDWAASTALQYLVDLSKVVGTKTTLVKGVGGTLIFLLQACDYWGITGTGTFVVVIQINDLDVKNVGRMIVKFENVTIICGFGIVKKIVPDDSKTQMESCAKYWQIEINLDKCKVKYFGKSNRDRTYTINGKVLRNADEQGSNSQFPKSGKAGRECDEDTWHAYLHRLGAKYKSWYIILALFPFLPTSLPLAFSVHTSSPYLFCFPLHLRPFPPISNQFPPPHPTPSIIYIHPSLCLALLHPYLAPSFLPLLQVFEKGSQPENSPILVLQQRCLIHKLLQQCVFSVNNTTELLLLMYRQRTYSATDILPVQSRQHSIPRLCTCISGVIPVLKFKNIHKHVRW